MDDDAIDIRFEGHYRQLVLTCGPTAFRRLRALLFSEAKADDKYAEADIRWIEIHLPPRQPDRVHFSGYVSLIGCGLVVCLLLASSIVGIHAIWRWLMGP